jgi:hypothetical protein
MVDFDGGGIIGFDFTYDATETMVLTSSATRGTATSKSNQIAFTGSLTKAIDISNGTMLSHLIILRDGDTKDLTRDTTAGIVLTGSKQSATSKPAFDQITFTDRLYKVVPSKTLTETMIFTGSMYKGAAWVPSGAITLTDLKTTSYEQSVARAPTLQVNIFSSSGSLSINTPSLKVNR